MTLPRWCLPAAAAVLAVAVPVGAARAQAPAQDPLCETAAPRLTFAISPVAAKKRPVRRGTAKPKKALVTPARATPAVAPLKRVLRKRRPRGAVKARPATRAPRTAVALPAAPRQSVPATRVCGPATLPLVLTGTPPGIAQIGPVPATPVEWPSTVQPQDSTGAGIFWWILGAGVAAGGATTLGGGGESSTPGGPAGIPAGPVVTPPTPSAPVAPPGSEPTPGAAGGTPVPPNVPGTPPEQPPALQPPPLVGTVPPGFPPGTVPPEMVPPGTFSPPGGELPPDDVPPGDVPPGTTPPRDTPPGRTPRDEPPGGTLVQVVPEPSSLGLLVGGGVALAGGLRARSRRR